MSRPSPIATDGSATGRWNTASVTFRSQVGASRAASAAQVPTTSASPPAMTAVCRLTIMLARLSSDSAAERFFVPRSDGNGPFQAPASAAAITVAIGATNTIATTAAKNVSVRYLARRVHSSTAASHQSGEQESVAAVQSERQRHLDGRDHGGARQVERDDAVGRSARVVS